MNLFWILPLLAQYTVGSAGYTATAETTNAGYLLFLSRGFTLTDVLFLGHSTFYLNGEWVQNYGPLAVTPIIAVLLPFILNRRNTPLALGLFTAFVVSLFMAKGANPPLGQVYVVLAQTLPLGFGRYLANGGSIFLQVTMAAAAPLMAMGVVLTSRKLVNLSRRVPWGRWLVQTRMTHSGATAFSRRVGPGTDLSPGLVIAVGTILLLAPITYGTTVDQRVYLPSFTATPIPQDYAQVNDFLAAQPGPFNIVWAPNGCCLEPSWKPTLLTDFPQSVSYRTVVSSPFPALEFLNVPNSTLTANWLALLGSRFVLVHSDVPDFRYAQFNASLSGQPGLSYSASFGSVSVYKVTSGTELPSVVYALPSVHGFKSDQANLSGTNYLVVGSHSSRTVVLNATSPYAAAFDGASYAMTSSPVSFAPGQDFAVSAWVHTSVASGTQIVAQDNVYGGSWNGWVLGLQDGDPWFQAGQASGSSDQGIVGNTSVADGTWHFLLGERVGTTIELFVDGQLVATKTGIPSIAVGGTENASIGARVMSFGAQAWYYTGSLANVQFIPSAATDSQVSRLYSLGFAGNASNDADLRPTFYLLDAARGSSYFSADESGNAFPVALNGTLNETNHVLPLEVGSQWGQNITITALHPRSSTEYDFTALIRGAGTIVLAEPFAPGWICQAAGSTVQGESLFGGLVTAFNVTGNGSMNLVLKYPTQDALVAGSIVTLVGFPLSIAIPALAVRRARRRNRPSSR